MRRSRAHSAALAVVLLVVGQLASLAHQAGTRHVTCTEHGEELEAATLVDELHACDHDHLVGVEDPGRGDHEDCAIARALHQSTRTSRFIALPQPVPSLAAAPHVARAVIVTDTALYLIAPKTSPPDRLRSLFA
jgi:hypothetical protein